MYLYCEDYENFFGEHARIYVYDNVTCTAVIFWEGEAPEKRNFSDVDRADLWLRRNGFIQ